MLRVLLIIVVAWAVVIAETLVIKLYDLHTGQAMAIGIVDGMAYLIAIFWAVAQARK